MPALLVGSPRMRVALARMGLGRCPGPRDQPYLARSRCWTDKGKPVRYADFAHRQREWLRGEVLEALLAYWRRQLAGPPLVLELPCDRPRPAAMRT
ncbi:MAG: hypothetical protein GY856_19500 [bacterium]|nr:hypothetical protein [bacterium]